MKTKGNISSGRTLRSFRPCNNFIRFISFVHLASSCAWQIQMKKEESKAVKYSHQLFSRLFTKYFFIHPLLLLSDNNSYIVRITIYTDKNVLFPSLFISYCPFYRIYQRMPISVMLVRRLIFITKSAYRSQYLIIVLRIFLYIKLNGASNCNWWFNSIECKLWLTEMTS